MTETYPLGRANVPPAIDGLIVPVEDAEEAEDESSSDRSARSSPNESRSSSSSSSGKSTSGSGIIGGNPLSFAFANARWRSLMMAGRLRRDVCGFDLLPFVGAK